MTVELGTTSLSQARLARGLTLEDAERSTRISRRFLIALEEHNYGVFPAPVYARGFLRTYCRYLGIDPEPQLAELPEGWTAAVPTTTAAPKVRRDMPKLDLNFNVAWLIAGAVFAAVLGAAIYMNRGGDDLGAALEAQNQGQPQQQPQGQAQNQGATGSSQPQSPGSAVTSPTQTASASTGRALDPGLPGILPDFTDVSVTDVTAFLTQQGIPFLRIDTASTEPEGLVIAQEPEAGVSTAGLGQVMLTVSAGASPAGTVRTDCAVLATSNQRSADEQTYYQNNCGSPAPELADRTQCEEIRGTSYRSPAERQFFLANCILN